METLETPAYTGMVEAFDEIETKSSTLDINIKLADDNVGLPVRGSEHAVAYDLKACVSKPMNSRLWIEFEGMGSRYKALFSHNGKWMIDYVNKFVSLYADQIATMPVEVIRHGECKLIDAGFSIEVPPGIGMFIYPRSGFKTKGIVSQPGIIDPDYRGPVKYEIYNLNPKIDFVIIQRGDRIAQAVFQPYYQANFNMVDDLSDTVRGTGGFGSTGV